MTTKAPPARGCGDLLATLVGRPAQVIFLSCNPGKGQVKYRARYRVDGLHAAAVEAILAKKAGLGPLRFLCCGWESTGGRNGHIRVRGSKGNLVGHISMRSQETLLKQRSDWPKIRSFYVTVEILDI